MFSTGHGIKLSFFIDWRKVIGYEPKQQPCMYWINLFLLLYLVTMSWDLW